MLCTIVWDVYRDDERGQVWRALQDLIPADSPDWSQKGIYAYWDPDTHELLYVGLAAYLPERFAQHNRLVSHSGGNKADKIDEWFSQHDQLGLTILMQGAAVETAGDLNSIDPLLGIDVGGVSRIAEGQLIELHKQAHGRWPAWNGVGGAVQGAEWARPSARSVISLLSAADENLFVARRPLRVLIGDRDALRYEALEHAARMEALMERHQVDDAAHLPPHERVEQIRRFLMLSAGKLVDDLVGLDELIRTWVERLSDADAMALRRFGPILEMQRMAKESENIKDQRSSMFIARLLLDGNDSADAETAAEVLTSGDLDRGPILPS